MKPPLSRHQHYHLRSLGLQLHAILAQLDLPLSERKTPLTRTVAGPALRAVDAAHRYANLPPHGLSAKGLMPGELVGEIISVLLHLKSLNTLSRKASAAVHQKSYPRRSGRE